MERKPWVALHWLHGWFRTQFLWWKLSKAAPVNHLETTHEASLRKKKMEWGHNFVVLIGVVITSVWSQPGRGWETGYEVISNYYNSQPCYSVVQWPHVKKYSDRLLFFMTSDPKILTKLKIFESVITSQDVWKVIKID